MNSCGIIRTPRLILRPFKDSDAKDVQRIAGDWEVARTTQNIPHPYEDGMAETWIAKHSELEKKNHIIKATTLGQSGELIGGININVDAALQTAEIGYFIAKAHWGMGYATEALEAIINFGFAKYPIEAIWAKHLSSNLASKKVMEKAGMTFFRLFPEEKNRSGKIEHKEGRIIYRRYYEMTKSRNKERGC